MYADPARIRKHVIKTYYDDKEYAVIKSLAEYTGGQPAVLARELALAHAVIMHSQIHDQDDIAKQA